MIWVLLGLLALFGVLYAVQCSHPNSTQIGESFNGSARHKCHSCGEVFIR